MVNYGIITIAFFVVIAMAGFDLSRFAIIAGALSVGTMMVRVTRIGIRSSVVRTFDRSEVIVPNADFISKEIVNWTLSDVARRRHHRCEAWRE